MQTILIAVNDFTDAHVERIKRAAAGWARVIRVDQSADQAVYDEALNKADIAVGWPRAQSVLHSPVRFLQLCSAGYDPYLGISLDKKENFILCNSRGVFSVPAAEQTIAMMLALTRRFYIHIREQPQHIWRRTGDYRIVDGTTMCVVGMGSIGHAIAERCAGLNMTVVGVTRTGKEAVKPPLSKVFAIDALGDALAIADHVVLSMPSSPQTDGMFDEAMFRRMKQGSCFYNVGRGSLVVEADLIKVIRDGHLWGAGLDVFATEPLPKDSPLWDMENVVITPHSAGRYLQEFDILCDLFVGNLERYHKGETLINCIDLSHIR